jgi:uncharacterized membrane protein YhaH (DUF805 family)
LLGAEKIIRIVGCAGRGTRESRVCAYVLDKQSGMEDVMDWYLMVWRRYAEFDGRSRRTEYWMFTLFNLLAIFALAIVGGLGIALIDNASGIGGILFIPLILYALAAFIPGLAVSVRRLHDSGKSGWLLLLLIVLGLIPIVGFLASVAQIVLMCLDSDPGDNQYGPNPKASELAGNTGFTTMGLGGQPQPFTGASNFRVCSACGAKLMDASSVCSQCGAHT